MTITAPAVNKPVSAAHIRYRLTITGVVQGVGFRPFFYRCAKTHAVSGHVMNSIDGVIAEIEGTTDQLNRLLHVLRTQAPTNATINNIEQLTLPVTGQPGFSIRDSSESGLSSVTVPTDLGSCDACIEELFTPGNRRYRYPFTNCAECGPRYSIIDSLPWDRQRTAMTGFILCAACGSEYHDPANRRFHAETNCCPDCGPQIEFRDASGNMLSKKETALIDATEAIRRGLIVAIKGPGGYQLLADAGNADTLRSLRARKQRPGKPFAVMFPSLASIQNICVVSVLEQALLTGSARPIVLLRRKDVSANIAPIVAPDNPYLGAMLAAMPLQYLLMASLDIPLVATSGNRSNEPIAIDNNEAIERLRGIADFFLDHDRPIRRPLDDSVVREICGKTQILRRARGYAPLPITSISIKPGIVASGGHLKSTVAITQTNSIVLSQHIGDLDHPLSRDRHAISTQELIELYRLQPQALSCDLHPDYYTTQTSEKWAENSGLPLVSVQHHLAHVAAVMAEHALTAPVLGVAWDGSGYGTDDTLWGGEFILVTDQGWQRKAHLRQFRLPGGSSAIREPRRAAFGLLYELYGDKLLQMEQLLPVAAFSSEERRTLLAMLQKNINAPVTSSAGRLFDAVAALLGLCQIGSYEGEAACKLEWLCNNDNTIDTYNFDVIATDEQTVEWIIDWQSAVEQILNDLAKAVPIDKIATAFHRGLASSIVKTVQNIGIQTIALTGGCFQNKLLTELTVNALQQQGFRVHFHEQVPPGDGGLALGQAYWASRMINNGEL